MDPGVAASATTLGVDGISLLLVLLTTFLMPLVLLVAGRDVTKRVKEFLVFMLFLETGMLGAFVALDLFLFYVFWELMLVPMYFLIGIWGGPRRVYAAIKFFLFTMVGSAARCCVGDPGPLLRCSDARRATSFDFARAARRSRIAPAAQRAGASSAFALAFAIKVPMFPFHTWLPDAHVEAPTGGLGDPGRRAAEDGHLRLPALRAAALPDGRRGAGRRADRRSR